MTAGGAHDKASGRRLGRRAGGVHQLQGLVICGESQLVEFQVTQPARGLGGIGAEHADIHLVEVGAAYVHADRQCSRREHRIHGLDFAENGIQRRQQGNAGVGTGCGKVLALASRGTTFQRRRPLQIGTLGTGIDLDHVGVCLDGLGTAAYGHRKPGLRQKLGPLVKPAVGFVAGRDEGRNFQRVRIPRGCDVTVFCGGQKIHRGGLLAQLVGALAVTDIDDEVSLTAIAYRTGKG